MGFVIVWLVNPYIQVLAAAAERTNVKYKKVKNMKKFSDSMYYKSVIETDISVILFVDILRILITKGREIV